MLKNLVLGAGVVALLVGCNYIRDRMPDLPLPGGDQDAMKPTRAADVPLKEGMVILAGIDSSKLEDQDKVNALLDEFGLSDPENQTGVAGLWATALTRETLFTPFSLERFQAQKGTKACAKAREEKLAYHRENNSDGSTAVPASFGKIIDLDFERGDEFWSGSLSVCTWIKNGASYDEYLISLKFLPDRDGSLRVVERDTSNPADPFPGTIDLSGTVDPSGVLAMLNAMNFKLHAKDDAIEVTNAVMNGATLPASHPIYKEGDDCFDFLVLTQADVDALANDLLPPQANYCMGRCDSRILNTY